MLKQAIKDLAKKAAGVKVHSIPEPKKKRMHGEMAVPYGQERPRLRLREDDLPAIKDWEHEGEYTLLMRVRQTGQEQSEYTKGKLESSFEVLEIAALPHTGKKG